ncbi:MAG: 16S rRNA (cytidine(1402)-2'-O)-methyltransferase [Christensenellaceae bacterium]|nr:16S rRNA (cytidine(1402)-2'-O)-methyltransferase [Christensenellaceae bacterium]
MKSEECTTSEKTAYEKVSLYLVATPIGNLEDITYRAVDVLRNVDMIACEDTRNTVILLNRYEIKNRLISFHEYSDRDKLEKLIAFMKEGNTLALVSDAGTPGISDPGYPLVKACLEEGLKVSSVPGPCAAVAALPMSGIDTRRFVFEGFIPRDKTRASVLKRICGRTDTQVIYESPHHLLETLTELSAVIPERKIAVIRELTKIHEESLLTTVLKARDHFLTVKPRGEFVLVLEGAEEKDDAPDEEAALLWLKKAMDEGITGKDAVRELQERFFLSKNAAKALVLKLKEEKGE